MGLESRNEHELIFAINTKPTPKMRFAVSSNPGQVYYDPDSSTYRVWFDGYEKDKAIEAIGNYILDRVAPEIRNHVSFIKRLQDEQDQAMKLLEQVSK